MDGRDAPAYFADMSFRPPIEKRSSQELMAIVMDAENWVPEARATARVELLARGFDPEEIRENETLQAKAVLMDHQQRELNAVESYSLLQLLGIFLIAPFLILGKLISVKLPLGIKLGLTELDRNNFNRKYRQRMAALIAGALVLVALFSLNR